MTPEADCQILVGDCLDRLRGLPDESVHCVVTSPPYWGLRDYGVGGQLGLEKTPEEYVANMVEVFREVRRVLRDDGVCWLNLGDSYAGPKGNTRGEGAGGGQARGEAMGFGKIKNLTPSGLKPKDLVGIPWRVAFALQADGWYLRQDIIWHKPNPMPESVTDRCTKAHEYVFLLSKSARYFYDAEAVKEPNAPATIERAKYHWAKPDTKAAGYQDLNGLNRDEPYPMDPSGRNRRSVWTITLKPFSEAHFATFPPELPEVCIRAGTSERGCCPECGGPWERVVERVREHGLAESAFPKSDGADSTARLHRRLKAARDAGAPHDNALGGTTTLGWRPTCDCINMDSLQAWDVPEALQAHNDPYDPVPCTVLDPFGGAGTTALVAQQLRRRAILIELNPEYADMARRRLEQDAGLFAGVEVATEKEKEPAIDLEPAIPFPEETTS